MPENSESCRIHPSNPILYIVKDNNSKEIHFACQQCIHSTYTSHSFESIKSIRERAIHMERNASDEKESIRLFLKLQKEVHEALSGMVRPLSHELTNETIVADIILLLETGTIESLCKGMFQMDTLHYQLEQMNSIRSEKCRVLESVYGLIKNSSKHTAKSIEQVEKNLMSCKQFDTQPVKIEIQPASHLTICSILKKVSQLQEQLLDLKNKNVEINELKEKLDKSFLQIENLQEQIVLIKQQKHEEAERLNILIDEEKKKSSYTQIALENKISELQHSLSQIKTENNTTTILLTEETKKLTIHYQQQKQKLNFEIAKYKSELSNSKTLLDQAGLNFKNLEAKITQQQQKFKFDLQQQRKRYDEDLKEWLKKVTNQSQQKVTNLTFENCKIKRETHLLQKLKKQLASQLQKNTVLLDNKISELDEAKTQISKLELDILKLTEQSEEQLAQQEENRKFYVYMNVRKAELQKELSQVLQEKQNLHEQFSVAYRTISSQAAEYSQRNQQLQTENRTLSEQITQLTKKLSRFESPQRREQERPIKPKDEQSPAAKEMVKLYQKIPRRNPFDTQNPERKPGTSIMQNLQKQKRQYW